MLEKVDSASEQDGSASPDELKCVLRGIPNSAFRVSEGDSLVAGESGRTVLRVRVTQDSMRISDAADEKLDRTTDYFFEATVSYGVLRYEIRTKKMTTPRAKARGI